jgi:hypothetical protein
MPGRIAFTVPLASSALPHLLSHIPLTAERVFGTMGRKRLGAGMTASSKDSLST